MRQDCEKTREEEEKTMRLWHIDLLPYLPQKQFKGQLRELVAIMHDWRDKGKTNHVLINRVMDYPKMHLVDYFITYSIKYERRIGKSINKSIFKEFREFCDKWENVKAFDGWHDKEYLRVCMANLYEKHKYGKGSSQITDSEWATLLEGYEIITGEEYRI